MTRHRSHLPQLDGELFLTDGGLETTLIFHDGLDLPYFAAFDLLKTVDGREILKRYFNRYATIARDQGMGFILEAATWRASPDWGEKLGYSKKALADANRAAVSLLEDVRRDYESQGVLTVISGCVGPRGDGYDPGEAMTPEEAEAYHAEQIGTFAGTAADMITAITMTNIEEAIGVAQAAKRAHMPVVISFTVETDGRLPTGDNLGKAIEAVDAATGAAPAYYMINCAHPTHFEGTLTGGGKWRDRVRGLRANASMRSHAELDAAEDLDDGNPAELGGQYRDLLRQFPLINVLGGCCGTDHRHVAEMAKACKAA